MTAIHNTRQTKRQTHSNFCIFKFCAYLFSYTRLFALRNCTFNATKISRSMVCDDYCESTIKYIIFHNQKMCSTKILLKVLAL